MPKALFVEMEAKAGAEADIESFLREALDTAEGEPHTRDWYALRFDEHRFAIFDTFEGNLHRLKHLLGGIGRRIVVKTLTELSGLPEMHSYELVAAKLPNGAGKPGAAYFVPFETKLGGGRDFGEVLVSARAIVEEEAAMLAWYALRSGPNSFAVLGFLADDAARDAHISGLFGERIRDTVGPFLEAPPAYRSAWVLGAKHSGWNAMTSAEQQMHPEQPVRVAPEAP
ncbi:MAG: antibiotic biosynthesis monooxygenase [Gluconacetobacter diazotrophicus]|nr:antibiotic biosynthesis monooxygenase [Gluconacetobacter diazotrophicus]